MSVKFRYRNIVTGKYQNKQPHPIYGGLLADVSLSLMLLYYRIQADSSKDMGLGKTLSALALIAWSLDMFDETSEGKKAIVTCPTLVIVTKSTVTGWMQQIEE